MEKLFCLCRGVELFDQYPAADLSFLYVHNIPKHIDELQP
jgi:hypothetical protein